MTNWNNINNKKSRRRKLMKKLSNQEIKQINGGNAWESLGEVTGKVLNKVDDVSISVVGKEIIKY
jgi:hypothetical protein